MTLTVLFYLGPQSHQGLEKFPLRIQAAMGWSIWNSFRTSTLLAEQSAQSTNKINRPQMCVSLQHSQFLVPADGAHLGNIEPALE